MKNKNLNLLVKSSILSRKLVSGFYLFFVMLSAVLILLSVSLVFPLSDNIENKINNHISNREIIIDFPQDKTDDEIKGDIEKIKNIEHIEVVYPIPSSLSVSEQSGILFDKYTLNDVHKGYTLNVTSGKAFSENETGVALVPEKIKDFNDNTKKIREIKGKDLIGKVLLVTDEFNNTHKIRVIGAYSTADPIFSGKEILIPHSDLYKLKKEGLKNYQGEASVFADKKAYMILVDNYKNTESVLNKVNLISECYPNVSAIDGDSYNMALIILFVSTGVFVILAIFGVFIFLQNNISNRTNEIALYRALGYKSKHIFYIVFSEYLFFGILSLAFGVVITLLLINSVVNPYLYTIVGNTIMEMAAKISVGQVLIVFLLFIILLWLMCRRAVKKSEKIDLTVLLRE